MVYVTHIRMSHPTAAGHEHITQVQWKNPESGKTGTSSVAEMIDYIENKNGAVKVTDGRRTVDVGVVNGHPRFIRTHADGVWTDNLLALPRF